MITCDGFRKKRCYLEGNNILIDGEAYPIESIKQTENYRLRMIFVMICLMFMSAYVAYGCYMGFQENSIANNNFKDRIVNTIFLLFGSGLVSVLWFAVIKFGYTHCRSFWLVNGKGVYIEQSDSIEIEQQLMELRRTLRNTGNKENESELSKKTHKTKEDWLWLFVAVFFFATLALGMGKYLPDNIFIPLLLVVAALIFLLRFYSIKKDFDNLKWKK